MWRNSSQRNHSRPRRMAILVVVVFIFLLFFRLAPWNIACGLVVFFVSHISLLDCFQGKPKGQRTIWEGSPSWTHAHANLINLSRSFLERGPVNKTHGKQSANLTQAPRAISSKFTRLSKDLGRQGLPPKEFPRILEDRGASSKPKVVFVQSLCSLPRLGGCEAEVHQEHGCGQRPRTAPGGPGPAFPA